MNSGFSYSTTYKLDKSHFSETYDESVSAESVNNRYAKAIILLLVGLILLFFTNVTGFLAWFFVGLGVIDALSVKYQKPWWLFRQMLSKAANNELTLTIDEQGVSTKSAMVESQLVWSEIERIESTDRGWLLYPARGKYYISNRCLSEDAVAFLVGKKDMCNSSD